jgi:hypothetical protein
MSVRGDGRALDAAPAYIGFVEHIIAGARGAIGKLQPVSEAVGDDRTPPRALAGDEVLEAFPHTGRVSWYDLPADIEKYSWWGFRVEESPTWDPDKPRHDQMQTMGTPLRAVEIIDLRPLGDEDAVRQVLTGRGVTLSHTPAALVYLWTSPDRWVGPVKLVPHATSAGQWIVDPHALHHPINVALAAPDIYIAAFTFEGTRRRFHVPQGKAGQREGRVDWTADDELLKRVLRDIRSMDPEFTDKLGISKQMIVHAVDRLKRHAFVGGEPEVVDQRLRRAARLIERVGARVDMARRIEDEVFRLPVFQDEIARRVREEASEAVRVALTAAQDQLATLAARVQSLRADEAKIWDDLAVLTAERQAEEARITAKRAELAQEREALEQRHDEIRRQFEERVQTLAANPGAMLADLAVLRMVVSGGEGTAQTVTTTLPETLHTASIPIAPRPRTPCGINPQVAPTIDDPNTLRQSLRLAGRRRGIPSRALQAIHATIVGGGLPVVTGQDALGALEAYAEAVSGGAILCVPVSPTTLEPADLLGRADNRGEFVPQASGLIDLLLDAHAEGPDGPLRVVVLEGLNRAPVDAYLTPLLDVMTTALTAAPRRLAVLAQSPQPTRTRGSPD